ncbi:MAG: sulfite exporter TauE/SafE family protein [Clostridia bacterium]|nr:sulfite exporter TauE/SafE family protein [Clostridia bacterium]
MRKNIKLLGGGALTGAANGLFGGGGGMIAVPVLEKSGMGALFAHATAIAVILPVCLVSGAVYLWFVPIPISQLLPIALGMTAGGLLGARLLPAVSAAGVTYIFAVLMLAAGVRLLF